MPFSRPENYATGVLAPIPAAALARMEQQLRRVVRTAGDSIRLVLIALLADGHVLIEDVPGVGKTTLAQAVSRLLAGSFQRIQFTSDLLPSDVTGISIYNQGRQQFEFHPGPIFANVVLADEINRTTPKTQSALLEAMSERQVTVDNASHELPRPFVVIATQNPVEHHGTYPLPESQLDRFLLRVRMGYPPKADEKAILLGQAGNSLLPEITPVLDPAQAIELQQLVRQVRVDDALVEYELQLVEATRRHPALRLGVSPRGAAMLHRAAQAAALLDGRDYCVPQDFKRLAVAAFAHRVALGTQYGPGNLQSEAADLILAEIRDAVPVPE